MSLLQLVFHLLNFVLPALALGVFMPLAGRWVMGTGGLAWPWRICWQAVAGVLVLLVGLVLQGHDGQMSTYVVMILVSGSLEWGLHRGWRQV
jgi:hypothetical protein